MVFRQWSECGKVDEVKFRTFVRLCVARKRVDRNLTSCDAWPNESWLFEVDASPYIFAFVQTMRDVVLRK